MTTQTNIFKRIVANVKAKRKNPDWARVEEPDTIARPAVYAVFGILIVGFSALAAFIVMTSSPLEAIALFLASFNSDLPFTELYAAFGAAVIVLVDLVVMTLFMLLAPADNDDLVEMISDLDANTQERFIELENTINEKLHSLKEEL
jgi:hypothetical protein